jgi:hypothetical protein
MLAVAGIVGLVLDPVAQPAADGPQVMGYSPTLLQLATGAGGGVLTAVPF